jgi:hypothetical protein
MDAQARREPPTELVNQIRLLSLSDCAVPTRATQSRDGNYRMLSVSR